MPGFKGISRLPRDTVRARRNATKFASDADTLFEAPLVVDGNGIIRLNTGDGLDTVSGLLVVDLADSNPGLKFTSGDLAVLLNPSEPGLQLTSGLKVLLAGTPGLELSSGLKAKVEGSGGVLIGGAGLYADLIVLVPYVGATAHVDLGNHDITTEGRIIATGGGETGKLLTGLAGFTVLAYSGDGLDIRAGEGGSAGQNVLRVTSVGNFDFYGGNITTTGSLGIGISTPTSPFHFYQNASTTGTNNGLTIEQDGGGDAKIAFLLTGQERVSFGLDNSDGNKLKIGDGGSVATNTRWEMDVPTGNVDMKSGNLVTTGTIIGGGAKVQMTSIGGIAVKLTNKTGGNTIAGHIVKTSTMTDDAFVLVGVNETNPIGIVLETGVSDGSETWVAVSGIAKVLVDAGGCVRGDRLITGAIGGFATVDNAPAVAVHFQEIGHCIETRVGAGLARCILHFN